MGVRANKHSKANENLSTRTLFRRDHGGIARVSGTLGLSGKQRAVVESPCSAKGYFSAIEDMRT